MPNEMSVDNLRQLTSYSFVTALGYAFLILVSVFGSRLYIQLKGKHLEVDWFTLYKWRMAALFLGPIAVILFHFWLRTRGNAK